MSYVFSVGSGSLPGVRVWKGSVYACVWLLPFMTPLSITAVNAARQQFHPVLNPSLPSPPTAECHPPSSACRAVRDTPNQVREQIQLKNGEVESFQDGSNQWKGGRGAEAIVVPGYFWLLLVTSWLLLLGCETKLPSPDSVEVHHTNSLKPQ